MYSKPMKMIVGGFGGVVKQHQAGGRDEAQLDRHSQ